MLKLYNREVSNLVSSLIGKQFGAIFSGPHELTGQSMSGATQLALRNIASGKA